ncbi:MAG: hypothetical protein A2V81_00415 [Candidatus Abawacabacteria bacterium RBG_16_42_10]|uniref:FecR protein domain-containing protein n=1 Tax=Candidatus Abawacabacteria bacterium RBG_16_42_10 TaxID=1817814 RepID=A0A1F4XKT9_9BACT|nr:MAG: hypothetical protein A2V81_00415 [Candidatus Abawacabacteria bacterium RBG_16_42_10]
MSRFTIFILVVIVLAAAAGSFLWLRGSRSLPEPTPTITATPSPTPTETLAAETAAILIEEGKVQLTHENKDTLVDEQSEVYVGDKIVTFADSRATLIFPDNDVLRLDNSTEITILALVSSDTEAKVKIEQHKGNTWSRVESILDKKREYSVETSTLVATVRGTVFNVDTASSDESWVGVTESTVDVERKEDKELLPVSAGNFASVKKGLRGQLAKILAEKIDEKKLSSTWFKDNASKDEKIKDFLTRIGKKKLEKNFLKNNHKMFFEKIIKAKLNGTLSGSLLPTTGVFDPKVALHYVLTGFVARNEATQVEANMMEADPYAEERVMTMKNNIEIANFVFEYLKRIRSSEPISESTVTPSPKPTFTEEPTSQPTPTQDPQETVDPTYFNPQFYYYFTPPPTQEPIK